MISWAPFWLIPVAVPTQVITCFSLCQNWPTRPMWWQMSLSQMWPTAIASRPVQEFYGGMSSMPHVIPSRAREWREEVLVKPQMAASCGPNKVTSPVCCVLFLRCSQRPGNPKQGLVRAWAVRKSKNQNSLPNASNSWEGGQTYLFGYSQKKHKNWPTELCAHH